MKIFENASEETHSNKNSLRISGEESAGLTFGLPCVGYADVDDSASMQKQTIIDYRLWRH